MGKSEHTFGGNNDTVCTPETIYGPLIKTLGPIGLDPFGHPDQIVAPKNLVLLPEYSLGRDNVDDAYRIVYGVEAVHYGDGLELDWSELCPEDMWAFCNGPYSDIAPWAHKMWVEANNGVESVGLCPVRTTGDYFQRWISRADVVQFLNFRIKFEGVEWGVPWHSVLFYFGPRADLYVKGMQQYGWCVRNQRDWG